MFSRNNEKTMKGAAPVLLFVIIAASFVLTSLVEIHGYRKPFADEVRYLGEAVRLKENGGVTNFLGQCFTGEYLEANRHPLSILILALFADRDDSFLLYSRYLNLAIAIAFLLIYYVFLRKEFGLFVACLATSLLAVNKVYINSSSIISCEPLLMIFMFVSYAILFKETSSAFDWFIAGITTGLAFLTKGNGIFLVPFIFLYAFMKKTNRMTLVGIFTIAFLFIASPLLIRNMVVFHEPLYNVNSSVLYLETFTDCHHPDFIENPPNLGRLLKENSFPALFARYRTGIHNEILLLFESYIPFFLSMFPGSVLFGLFCTGLAIWGFVVEDQKKKLVLIIPLVVVFLLFFSWYGTIVSGAKRFLLPVMPWLFLYTAKGIEDVIKRSKKYEILKNVLYGCTLLFVLLISMFLLGKHHHLVSGNMDDEWINDHAYTDLREWFTNSFPEGEKYCFDAYQLQFGWQTWANKEYQFEHLPNRIVQGRRSRFFPPMKDMNFQEFQEFFNRYDIRYLIITVYSIQQGYELFNEFVEMDETLGLRSKINNSTWQVIQEDSRIPKKYIVFKYSRERLL